MSLSYIKDKDISLKESYKTDETSKTVNFKILVNKSEIIKLEGKSIKTLRKQAYKKLFYYLLDNSQLYIKKEKEKLSVKEIF